jgi:hypothetical protein
VNLGLGYIIYGSTTAKKDFDLARQNYLNPNIGIHLNGGLNESIKRRSNQKRIEMKDNTDSIDELYQDYWAVHAQMISKGHSPLEIAAILVAQSMSIYKTVLDSKDYDKMVDDISKMRYNVKELTPEQGHYH